jgi:hypothetical protein
VLRKRLLEALKRKARRGELFMTVATATCGFGPNCIEKDPDRRIQEAIAFVSMPLRPSFNSYLRR